MVEEHPAEHRGDEHGGLVLAGAERHQRRPGAEAADAPADAEHDAAGDETRIDVAPRRDVHCGAEKAPGAALAEGERDRADRDRPRHHEGERRVPPAREVEEADDLAGIGHPGQEQPQPEQQSRAEGGERVHPAPEATCRSRNTVAKPASMKAAVATIERGERRDRPQTPCPLVQPEP